MSQKLAAVISYCTNDFRFIGKCISEAKLFADQILIPVCDHFYDGSPENRPLLEKTYREHPDCRFVEFAYLPDKLYSPYHPLAPGHPDWPALWAATSRYIGLHYLDPSIEWVLFLDSDEILEGSRFLNWLKTNDYQKYDCQRLAAYLYAVLPTQRAKKLVNLPLLVKKNTLAPLTLLNPLERIGAYQMHPGPKRECVMDHSPFVHHYSWVRTKEECLKKAETWSHRSEKDWPLLIDEAFSGKPASLFDGHPDWEKVEAPYFNPFAENANVLKVKERDLRLKEIEAL